MLPADIIFTADKSTGVSEISSAVSRAVYRLLGSLL